jgi:plasmid stabilization system protein ParE
VPSLIVGETALSDLARIADFLEKDDSSSSKKIVTIILEALEILQQHPCIGRVTGRHRELVISHGSTGYIALYDFDEARDRIMVQGVRHQREAGFEE